VSKLNLLSPSFRPEIILEVFFQEKLQFLKMPALYLVLIALAVILLVSVIKSSVRPSNFPPGKILKSYYFVVGFDWKPHFVYNVIENVNHDEN